MFEFWVAFGWVENHSQLQDVSPRGEVASAIKDFQTARCARFSDIRPVATLPLQRPHALAFEQPAPNLSVLRDLGV
jgi:hypothetical protein